MGQLVNVSVPEEHLGEVYSLLGKLAGGVGGLVDGAERARGAEGWWTEKRLRKAFDQSSQAQRVILKAMAEGKGNWVPVSEVVEALEDALGEGANWNSMAGALGAFGRRIRSRYGAKERPFTIRYNHDLGQKEYLMPEHIADIVASF